MVGSRWEGVRALRTAVRRDPGLLRLVTVRLLGPLGDGTVQAALLGVVFFSPEQETEPFAIAAGFAVLLLPYSVLGPFAAAALDRWDRRLVLVVGTVLRALLMCVLAVGMLTGGSANPGGRSLMFGVALALAGTSRFIAAGINAAMPHVTPVAGLVVLNSVLATAGAVLAASGALVSLAVLAVVGTDASAGVTVAVAAVTPVVAAVLMTRFAPQSLGPGRVIRRSLVAVATDLGLGLARGLGAAWRAPRVTAALAGLVAHRAVFGVNTMVGVLVMRQAESVEGPGLLSGIGGFGLVVAAVTTGMFLAAVLTPVLVRRFGVRASVLGALVVLVAGQVGLLATVSPRGLVAGGLVLGCAGQVVKLCGDAAMLLDVPTWRRGQVFAVQDMLFNAVFVLALVGAAPFVPQDGHAPTLVAGLGALYLLAALLVAGDVRRRAVPVDTVAVSRPRR